MTGKVGSDHPSVRTVDGELRSHGATSRLKAVFPAGTAPTGEVVRLVVGGERTRARFVEGRDGVELRGAYDTPDGARDPAGGTDRLQDWLDDCELDGGRTVHLDEVVAGSRYGLRAPGERAVYDDVSSPDDSLADIARDLDG